MNKKEEEFLNWLEEQNGYYVKNSVVKEKFPDLDLDLGMVTMKYDPETGETSTPIRDYEQAIRYGQPLD